LKGLPHKVKRPSNPPPQKKIEAVKKKKTKKEKQKKYIGLNPEWATYENWVVFWEEVSNRKVINFRHCATSKFFNLGNTQDDMPPKLFIWQHGVVN